MGPPCKPMLPLCLSQFVDDFDRLAQRAAWRPRLRQFPLARAPGAYVKAHQSDRFARSSCDVDQWALASAHKNILCFNSGAPLPAPSSWLKIKPRKGRAEALLAYDPPSGRFFSSLKCAPAKTKKTQAGVCAIVTFLFSHRETAPCPPLEKRPMQAHHLATGPKQIKCHILAAF